MATPQIRTLPIAVRVFPDGVAQEPNRFWREPEAILIVHTETCGKKRGLLGSYRVLLDGECTDEGLFYNHLSKSTLKTVKKYSNSHRADIANGRSRPLRLLTRSEFLKLLYELAYKSRCLVIGFDLAVHLSRLAFNTASARGFFEGGFSLGLWSYTDKEGRECPNGFRPRIAVKYIDRKRSLIGFTARNSPDQEDLIPVDSQSGEPKPGYRFPGHFLDARTLAHALADELYSLEDACKAFGVNYGPQYATS